MMNERAPSTVIGRRSANRAFTLIELLVVMGIIAVLSAITAISYRSIAQDAKLSSAKNAVTAVLDNARGLAMKNNQIVIAVFRPRIDGRTQYVEVTLAQWTGQSIPYLVDFGNPQPSVQAIDRYVPIPNVAQRMLSTGIQIGGPAYAKGYDDEWITLSNLPSINTAGQGEIPGSILGVMFGPDGRNIVYNAKSDAQRLWVDFNNDGLQKWDGFNPIPYSLTVPLNGGTAPFKTAFDHLFDDDEPCVSLVPFLTVFDDDQVRQFYDVSQWNMLTVGSITAETNRRNDYNDYINKNADRIHFNRYTGVVMK